MRDVLERQPLARVVEADDVDGALSDEDVRRCVVAVVRDREPGAIRERRLELLQPREDRVVELPDGPVDGGGERQIALGFTDQGCERRLAVAAGARLILHELQPHPRAAHERRETAHGARAAARPPQHRRDRLPSRAREHERRSLPVVQQDLRNGVDGPAMRDAEHHLGAHSHQQWRNS